MGFKIGSISSDTMLINEYRISVLEHLLQWIIENNKDKLNIPNQNVVDGIRKKVFSDLQNKYPDAELKLRGD